MKRTTGIPKSFLKTVEKPSAIANDGTVDDTKHPSGVMINADGDWVIAEPDKASWDQYQARAKVSAAAQEAVVQGSKVLQERGLECPLDKRLFIEPSQTPCCQKTYCLECITNALLENDLQCPHCSHENVLLDELKPDTQMAERVQEYEKEQQLKVSAEATKPLKKDPQHDAVLIKHEGKEATQSPKSKLSPKDAKAILTEAAETVKDGSKAPADNTTRKRSAEGDLNGPAQKITKQEESNASHGPTNTPLQPWTGNLEPNQAGTGTMGPMGLPVSAAFMNMPINMMSMMPMQNPMSMANPFLGGAGNWNAMWNGGYSQQPMGMAGGGGFMNGSMNGQFGTHNMNMGMDHGFGTPNAMNSTGSGRGTFSNQQRNHFGGSRANEEDSAYFRKPVNPHRHQGRRNVNRPADYREI